MIAEGKRAPAFRLASSDGNEVSLADYAGQRVVIYFYPKDNTPGCTIEANDFNAVLPTLRKIGVAVLGVSKDSIASHCRFRDKFGLKFPLLSDPEGKMLEKYGAWGEKTLYGRKFMGIKRTTVIVGADGKVEKVFENVRAKGHVDSVLEALGGAASAPKKKSAKKSSKKSSKKKAAKKASKNKSAKKRAKR
jgi:peroxiredoxin Q/BCP